MFCSCLCLIDAKLYICFVLVSSKRAIHYFCLPTLCSSCINLDQVKHLWSKESRTLNSLYSFDVSSVLLLKEIATGVESIDTPADTLTFVNISNMKI